MNQHPPLRFYMVNETKKPLLRWLWDFRLLLPHRYYDHDSERWSFTRHTHNPRYTQTAGPLLKQGDPGYDDAPYEVAFLYSSQSCIRLIPESLP